MSRFPSALSFALCIAMALPTLACSNDDAAGTKAPGSGATSPALANAGPVTSQYATNVYANYTDCLVTAQTLKTAVDAFIASPSAATQGAAKAAWVSARLPYGQTEVYRFYGGPIDDDVTGTESAINAWPLDENFIDYTRDDAASGIINRPDLVATITKESVKAKNEEGGEKNIATGFHAIEFLLWGQDLDAPVLKTAGARPFTDYVDGGTAANQGRRRQYLAAVTDLLVEDLEAIAAAWAPGSENYAKTFAENPRDAITKMLTGMGSLGNAELSGQRMTVAYKNRTQEDEHSCFSDTTNADLLGNMLGIQNVYLGAYGAADGPGIDDLVKAASPGLDAQMKSDLSAAVAALTAIQSTPFDAALDAPDGTPERDAILTAIQAVKKVAATTVAVGQKLGVTFQVEEPSEAL